MKADVFIHQLGLDIYTGIGDDISGMVVGIEY